MHLLARSVLVCGTGSARRPTQHVNANRQVCSMPLQRKFIDAHLRMEPDAPTTSESVEAPLLMRGLRQAFVAQVDLLHPAIEKALDCYVDMERITGVSQLMAWNRAQQSPRPRSINLLADP